MDTDGEWGKRHTNASKIRMTQNLVYQKAGTVDNRPPNTFGESRIGRKARRKALDRHFKALRLLEGRPAKSGPPIPNSEKRGHREFYTLEQCRRGGRASGNTRRAKAAKRWREVELLSRRGQGIRQIAAVVGYSPGWVSRLVKRLCGVFREHIHHRPTAAPPGARTFSLLELYHWRLSNLLRSTPNRRDRSRLERLKYTTERRILAYVDKVEEAAPVQAVLMIKSAVERRRALADVPIAEATRLVNSEFRYA